MNDRLTLFIIDSCDADRAALREALGDAYRYLEASDSAAALTLLHCNQNIGGIVLDFSASVTDSEAFLLQRKEHQMDHTIPVIAALPLHNPALEEAAFRLGANEILHKPYIPATARARVSMVLYNTLTPHIPPQKIQALLQHFPGAAIVFDVRDHRLSIAFVSNGCAQVTGFTPQEIMERLATDAFYDVHPDDKCKLINMSHETLAGRQPTSYTFRARCKDGTYKWLSLSLAPSTFHGNLRYYGIYTDVNEEHENSMVLDQLVNALPGGVAIYRIGETVETLYSSDGVPELSGRTMEEYQAWISEDLFGNAVYQDDLPLMTQRLQEAVSHGAPLNITYRLRHKDGSLVWLQLSASKIRDEGDCQIYYAIYTKPTEEVALYKSAVEDSPTAVLVIEQERRKILYSNTVFRTLLEIDDSQLIVGTPITELAAHSNCLLTEEERDSLSEKTYQRFLKRSRLGKYIVITAKAIRWNGISAYICYISDETEIRESHRQLQELLDKIPDGIGIYEIRNGQLILNYMNDAYYQMIGDSSQNRQAFLGASTINATYEADIPVIQSAIRSLEQGQDSLDIHYRVCHTNGTCRWLRLTARVTQRTPEKITLYACFSDYEKIMLAQQEMLSNRKMLDMALDAAKAMVWRYDPYERRITDSASLGKAYQLPTILERMPDCLIETGLIHPESIQDLRALFDRMPSADVLTVDVKVKSATRKSLVWERLIYTPVFDENGRVIEEIGSTIDITEQKLAEERYEKEIQMQNELLHDCLIFYQVNVTKWQLEACRLIGGELEYYPVPQSFDEAEWIATVQKYVDEPYLQRYLENMNMDRLFAAFESGTFSVVCPAFHLNHALTDQWCEAEASLTKHPGTEDIIARVYIRNVDLEYKKQLALDSIVDEETEFISLLQVATGNARVIKVNPACYLTPEHECYNFNQFAAEQITLSAEPEEQAACREYFDCEKLVQRLAFTDVDTHTFCCRQPDGNIHRKKTRAFYLDESKQDIVIVRRDITDLFNEAQLQEAQLKEALAAAQEASVAKSDFLSRMSHDMRTPMNGILGLVALSREETDPAVIQENLTQIELSGHYLLALINDTLDMSKIEAGKLELHLEPINSEELFSNIITNAYMLAKESKVRLRLKTPGIAPGQWATVLGDHSRIEQVLINVISNAIKFTPAGGTVDLIMETVSVDEQQVVDRYIIRDTGIGMSEAFLPHLFEPFSQEGRTKTSYKEGTGLGMPIVKQIVDLMGSDISVKSKLNEGTEVTLLMRYQRSDTPVSKQRLQAADLQILHGKRVLVCEDHPLNAQIAERLLKKQGMQTELAENGQVGLQRFADSPVGYFDLILMDVRMPEMNGLEATEAIRRLERPDAKGIPIIAMTANAFDTDVDNCLRVGMDAHLSKPVDPQLLYATLSKALLERGRSDEIT